MPGLFGFHITGRDNQSLRHQSILKKQKNVLLHHGGYIATQATLSSCAFGRVDIKEKFSKIIHRDTRRKLIISFWGELFECSNSVLLEEGQIDKSPEQIVAEIYEKYGTQVAEKLNGDFVCVIHDEAKKKTILFNDRFGFRPLYYYRDNEIFIFAPEIKALLVYEKIDKTINWQSVSDYLRYGYVLGDRTLFEHVKLLPAATTIEIDEGGYNAVKYFHPHYKNKIGLDKIDDAVEEGIERFRKSIQRRIRKSQKILIFLSGGLDSRLITAVANEYGAEITTVTQGYRYSYESYLAKKVCRTLSLKTPKRIPIDKSWMNKYLYEMAYASEAGYGSLGLFWQHGIANAIGTDFDCMLNGIFGGHLSYGSPYFNQTDLVSKYTSSERLLRIDRGFNGHLFSRIETALNQSLKSKILDYGLLSLEQEIERASTQSEIPCYQQDAVFINNRIRRGMVAVDQNRIYYNDKYPFASYELYEFYLKLKPELMLGHRLYKEIYKRKFPDLAKIPWWSTGTDLYTEKNGFQKTVRESVEKASWYISRASLGRIDLPHPWMVRYEDKIFRKENSIRNSIRDILNSDQCRRRGLYNLDIVNKMINNTKEANHSINSLGKLVLLEYWFQLFVDGQNSVGG